MTNDFDPVSPEVNHSSPGKLLHDAREQLGLTQGEVAKALFMTLTKVKAIEADQYTRLHSDTFIRGYLRAYAQLVNVDIANVLSIYDGQAKILGLKEEFVPVRQDASARKIWQFAGLLIGLLLLIWLASVWFLDNRKKNDYSNISVVIPSKEIPVVVQSSVMSDQESSVASAVNSSSATSQPKITVPVSTGHDRLEFSFRDECWVEVSDANGDVLVTELQFKGSQLALKGKAPFDVKLGNAPAVSLKMNDENVTLVPALGTNVLTLKVGHKSGQ